jgi:hypothetical protein
VLLGPPTSLVLVKDISGSTEERIVKPLEASEVYVAFTGIKSTLFQFALAVPFFLALYNA